MLNIKDINRYFLRLTKLAERPDIVGQVVYLRHVTVNGIVVSMTDDCRPNPTLISLPASANDNGWYDATELILAANSAITPRYDMCTFTNDIARQYRNHIEDASALVICEGRRAIGRLCFIGYRSGNRLEFSKTAYFVVFLDEHGFYITYSGFCEPKKKQRLYKINQRVLRLEGTGKEFFAAEPIVTFCNEMYSGDVALRDQYMNDIRERAATSSITTRHVVDPKLDPKYLTGMRLD